MRRREFITLLGGAAAAWPHFSFAQRNDKVRRVGVLANEPWPPLFGLRDGLGELGYIEKQNLDLVYRFAEGQSGRYAALAEDLVRLPVDVIVTWGTPASLAAIVSVARPLRPGCIADASSSVPTARVGLGSSTNGRPSMVAVP